MAPETLKKAGPARWSEEVGMRRPRQGTSRVQPGTGRTRLAQPRGSGRHRREVTGVVGVAGGNRLAVRREGGAESAERFELFRRRRLAAREVPQVKVSAVAAGAQRLAVRRQ